MIWHYQSHGEGLPRQLPIAIISCSLQFMQQIAKVGHCKRLQQTNRLAEKVLTLQCCFSPEACGQGQEGSRKEQIEKYRRGCIALWRT